MSIAVSGVGNGFSQPDHFAEQVSGKHAGASRAQEEARAQAAAVLELDTVTKDLEKITLAFNKKLRFTVDHQTDEIVVKVVDPETDTVIKELPPEELQRLHHRLKEMIGLLFDEVV